MRRIPILISLMVFTASFIIAAPITLDDAIESAKENNISLEISQIQLRQSLRNASTL